MTAFPRFEFFSAREKRGAAILAASLVAVLVASVAYLRPVQQRPVPVPSAAVALQPSSLNLIPATATTAYLESAGASLNFPRTLFATADAGRSWHRLRAPSGLIGLQVLGGGSVLIASTVPTLASTPGRVSASIFARYDQWLSQDGGRSWRDLILPRRGTDFDETYFAGADSWYFVIYGQGGLFIYLSTDQARSWRLLTSVAGPNVALGSVAVSVVHSFVVGAGAYWLVVQEPAFGREHVLRSADGGATWAEVKVPAPPAGAARGIPMPQFSSDGRAWMQWLVADDRHLAARFGGYVSTSLDGGLTWSTPRLLAHVPVATLPGSVDWWATDGTSLFRSSDLGQSWSTIKPVLPSGVDRLGFPDRVSSQAAWTILGRTLTRTVDGGRHWVLVKVPAG